MLSEEIEKATNGELKARLHLSGTLQIAPNNITPAVAEGVVQLADDLFNSGNIPVAGIPRLPGLVRTLDEFKKTADVLRPYLEKAFAEKGIVMLADYTYPLQVVWGKKKLTSLDDFKGMKLRVAQPEQGEMVRRFGGTSVTIAAPEVPSALDRGVVDGIFTAGVGAVLWKDLLKYGFLIPVNWNNSYILANAEAYNKLSPDLQAQAAQGRAGRREVEPGHDADRRGRIREGADRRRLHHDHRDGRGSRQGRRHHEALLGRLGEVARARWWSRRSARCAPRSDR